jgi:hypothetical protein
MRTNHQGQQGFSFPHQQAVDMTTPEAFATASKQPLTTGRRPDTTGIFSIVVVHCVVFARQQIPKRSPAQACD